MGDGLGITIKSSGVINTITSAPFHPDINQESRAFLQCFPVGRGRFANWASVKLLNVRNPSSLAASEAFSAGEKR